jgi:chorismate mutase/prephenate dehydratase
MSDHNLPILRTQVDQIDAKIQELITQRAQLAQQIARAKYREEENTLDFYRPEREADVLRQVISRNQGPLTDDALVAVFREMISACLALQKPLSVAFLGPKGTYSQAAVLKHFGHSAHIVPLSSIEEVFRDVEAHTVRYGVVPVENSTEGGVNQTLDCFINTSLKICGEIEVAIHHHLMSLAPELRAIKRLYVHQQTLAQCRLWLDTHLPMIERFTVNSNAEAARRAAEEPHSAAIAGQMAAEIYQLPVLASRIESDVKNMTRFVVLGHQEVPPTGKDKTSLLLASINCPGSLYQLIKPFADNAVSMTRIESRPSRQARWEYVFFVDIEGHLQDSAVANALKTLQNHASLVKYLGSYPSAIG